MLVTNECMIEQSFQKTMADIESRMETRPRGKGVDRKATKSRNDALRGVRLIDRESVDLFMESL